MSNLLFTYLTMDLFKNFVVIPFVVLIGGYASYKASIKLQEKRVKCAEDIIEPISPAVVKRETFKLTKPQNKLRTIKTQTRLRNQSAKREIKEVCTLSKKAKTIIRIQESHENDSNFINDSELQLNEEPVKSECPYDRKNQKFVEECKAKDQTIIDEYVAILLKEQKLSEESLSQSQSKSNSESEELNSYQECPYAIETEVKFGQSSGDKVEPEIESLEPASVKDVAIRLLENSNSLSKVRLEC